MFRFRSRAMGMAAGLALGVTIAASATGAEAPAAIRVYVGTYTAKMSKGIYMMDLDPATGALSKPVLACETSNPSWITFSPDHKYLYSCAENSPKEKDFIAAFAVGNDGMLKFLNKQEMPGGPCHATVDATGKNVLIANYGNGTVATMRVEAGGKLQPAGWIEKHPPGADANQVPHAHFISPDLANHFVLSNDAGDDKVWVYRFDAAAGTLAANDPPYASLPPHAAPRHLAFSPNGKFVYTIQEAASTVTAFTYDAEHGVLHDIQSISTLPEGFTGKDLTTAELIMHPSGKFLYGSNRGHDSIVTYRVNGQTGKLTLVSHTPSGGKIPRGLGIDPTGQWLFAGNQNSDKLVEFHVDPETGEPKATGISIELGAPVCFQFVQLAK